RGRSCLRSHSSRSHRRWVPKTRYTSRHLECDTGRVRANLAFAIAAAGCYQPTPAAPCTVSCDHGACPAAFECGMDNFCHAPGGGGCTTDASIADAPADSVDAMATGPGLLQEAIGSRSMTDSVIATLGMLPHDGNVLVMIGANSAGQLQTVTGGGVAAWTRADRSLQCPNTEIWFGVTNGGSESVTIMGGDPTGNAWLWVGEWSGLDTS